MQYNTRLFLMKEGAGEGEGYRSKQKQPTKDLSQVLRAYLENHREGADSFLSLCRP